ncbi:glutamate 5-kinase [Saccharopolyspora lacisalsi]|uniref:Glutamate 5-kinase n=1 Tax=Halosaccharopolyspora lacisalsi TaxID=1000566 RepID=A0A839E131_9PSEU|nr:glutamate 5-kinase [Halosaccharopolyspora lacisalsi]MBA8825395.1 glutamate 5-kinase [Halosaccharopolyspora lacisalsi]
MSPDETLAESPARQAVGAARRLVVKVGSSSLTTTEGGLDHDRLAVLVDALAARVAAGSQLVLVSSGAIAAGIAPLGLRSRPRDLATQQAAASVGQQALAHAYAASFARYRFTVGQVLLTADDVVRRSHYRNARRTLNRLLTLGAVAVVNENDTVATSEIRFGDNDRLAALVAHLVDADALVLLSDVDALYDGDPRDGDASVVREVADAADLEGVSAGDTGASGLGTGGMASKVGAASVACSAGVPVLLTSAAQASSALGRADVGTAFASTGPQLSARRFWLAHAAGAQGLLRLDEGAVTAVVQRRRSLLTAGITGVEGSFEGGDVVELADPAGSVVARGVVAYDAAELPELIGRSSHELPPEQRREVIHADDLVPL